MYVYILLIIPWFVSETFSEMVTLRAAGPLVCYSSSVCEYRPLIFPSLGRLKLASVAVNNAIGLDRSYQGWGFCCGADASGIFKASTNNCSAIHGKSTLACALSQGLHARRKLTYILDGDNIRHGLNSDLSFEPEDRAENIRRIGEVARLFADAGIICIASLISPFRKDRDACRALLAEGDFIEVFLDVPLNVCEARDPKGLYKLSRAGKIQGFTGIDDPYEQPLNCEIVLQYKEGICSSPNDMAETMISYLDERGYLQA
ncbi:adenylyl-sulfate kinase 3-like isoform X3 [Momordica charantia]|uniref:Adenylyl-sulfate kinase n=1 Tax=Momordica charantia TaxID=3673 RepID=A0A6J1BVH1_MOMCH|nr:adenylyl-sulfate kinase 3-like isoform X3 [Momordica charantia]